MPALPTDLVKAGSTYKLRSRIPQDLLQYYHPKKELINDIIPTVVINRDYPLAPKSL